MVDPLSSSDFSSVDSLCHDLSTLTDLASRGSYLSLLGQITTARNNTLTKPHEHLTYLTFSVLSLFKLRRFSEASSELLDQPLDSSSSSSMVPFALRWLHALLPSKLGDRPLTLDRLYTLLDFVRKKLNYSSSSSLPLWRKRDSLVLNTIISHHLSQKEFLLCLNLLKDALSKEKENENDVFLVSKLGYVQLQIGDLDGAKATFDKVEKLMKESLVEENVRVRNLVSRNKALVYLIGKDYLSAVREYEECIETDGTDGVAINNKAICLMYLRELSGSITVLESALERVPTVVLSEPIVVNLCSMYELAYVNHLEIKKTLSDWIARVAPDDFDKSSTRI